MAIIPYSVKATPSRPLRRENHRPLQILSTGININPDWPHQVSAGIPFKTCQCLLRRCHQLIGKGVITLIPVQRYRALRHVAPLVAVIVKVDLLRCGLQPVTTWHP